MPPLAQGHELAAFALTEPGAGSDAGALRTRADGDGRLDRREAVDHQRLPRRTCFIVVRPRGRPPGISAFVVRRGAPGLGGHARGGEARPELVLDRRPGLDGHARPSGSARARARAADRAAARSTAGGSGSRRRRSASPRRRSTLAVAYAKERQHVRQADRRARPGSRPSSPTCRRRSRRARALTWRGRAAEGRRAPAHASRAPRPSCSPPRVARRQTGEAIQVLGGYGYTKRVPGRALLPRREGHRDLRGHERDPAARDRARAAGRRGARVAAAPTATPESPLCSHRPEPAKEGQGAGHSSTTR